MPSHLPPRASVTKAGPLPSTGITRLHRDYEPLGLPPDSAPFRTRLMGAVFARRRRSGRASPVPCRAFAAYSPPYPEDVLHLSGSAGCSLLPSPHHDRLGRPSLSGALFSGLRGWLQAEPAALLPSIGLDRDRTLPNRAVDAPLGRRLEPASRLYGQNLGGTFTCKSDTVCQAASRLSMRGGRALRARTHHQLMLGTQLSTVLTAKEGGSAEHAAPRDGNAVRRSCRRGGAAKGPRRRSPRVDQSAGKRCGLPDRHEASTKGVHAQQSPTPSWPIP